MSDTTNPATDAMRAKISAAHTNVDADPDDLGALGGGLREVMDVVDEMLQGLGGLLNQMADVQARFAAFCSSPQPDPDAPPPPPE